MTLDRWWSWNADLPAEMRHLPSGFVVTPVLYAASRNQTSRLPPGEGVVFGRRPIGDEEIGLGLALSRGLARDLGGDLQLDPRGGGGACFELTLPLN